MPHGAQSESERQTRRKRVNPLLKASGWEVVPFEASCPTVRYTHHAVTEYPTANGPADYALFSEGQPLGVVEAKRLSLGPQNVLTQSERYSKGVTDSPFNFDGYRAVLYSTNGEVLWFHDIRHALNRSRRIAGFHMPAALTELLGRDVEKACGWFGENPNNHSRLRPYQIEANAAIEKAIADRKRQMLVAMATGTGKTFTMVNQTYRLSIMSASLQKSSVMGFLLWRHGQFEGFHLLPGAAPPSTIEEGGPSGFTRQAPDRQTGDLGRRLLSQPDFQELHRRGG